MVEDIAEVLGIGRDLLKEVPLGFDGTAKSRLR